MKHTLRDLIEGEKTNYAFTLINIQDYNYRTLLASDVPEEIMLALLSDFQSEDPTVVVRQVLERLLKASADKTKLQRYLRQLTVLAQLRSLREETQRQLRAMPITFDITKDSLYLQGKEEGVEKGKKELIIRFLKTTDLSIIELAKAAEVSQ